tara:strand:+ start:160 stop:378 length:219 start_codon:yes stop_codon:yes gene_type:complete
MNTQIEQVKRLAKLLDEIELHQNTYDAASDIMESDLSYCIVLELEREQAKNKQTIKELKKQYNQATELLTKF